MQVVGNLWLPLEKGTEDVASLPEFREDTANPGCRNIADRLGVRHSIDLPVK